MECGEEAGNDNTGNRESIMKVMNNTSFFTDWDRISMNLQYIHAMLDKTHIGHRQARKLLDNGQNVL